MDLASVLVRRVERLESCCEDNKTKIRELEGQITRTRSERNTYPEFANHATHIFTLSTKRIRSEVDNIYAKELNSNLRQSNISLITYPSFLDEIAEGRNLAMNKINELIKEYLYLAQLYKLAGDDTNYEGMKGNAVRADTFRDAIMKRCEQKNRDVYELRLQQHNDEMSRTGELTPYDPYQPLYMQITHGQSPPFSVRLIGSHRRSGGRKTRRNKKRNSFKK
jgi:hypothetical protein